jgi:hypothetical protein
VQHHGQPVGIPSFQSGDGTRLGHAGLCQKVRYGNGGPGDGMAGQDQGLVNDAIRGECEESRIKGISEAFRQKCGTRRMPKRHMQDVMRDQSNLFWQAEEIKSRPVADNLTSRCCRSGSVAVTTPEGQDGERCIDLTQMGNGLGGAG